jgi:subtilisin family serine protease
MPPGPEKHTRYNEHFNYQWTNQKTIDVATVRATMDNTMCATVFAPTNVIGRQLTNALVWFSTDADCNIVGAVVADDYAIVYNNNSDLIINFPPGFLEKKDE